MLFGRGVCEYQHPFVLPVSVFIYACTVLCFTHVHNYTGTHSWEQVEWEEHNAKHTDLSSAAREAHLGGT